MSLPVCPVLIFNPGHPLRATVRAMMQDDVPWSCALVEHSGLCVNFKLPLCY